MWLQKLKKKKLQCFLIGMFIFLSTLIFTSSLSLITSITDYVNKYYANDKYYDIIIYKANESAKNDVLNWCKSNNKIDGVKAFEDLSSGYNMYNKGEKLDVSSYDIVPLEDAQNIPFGITRIKCINNNRVPEKGEVWITQLFSDNYHVALGDNINFKEKDKTISLKVTALINDSMQPSSMIGTDCLYTSNSNINDFSGFKKEEMIFINPKKNVDVKNMEKDISSIKGLGGYLLDKDTLKLGATALISMIGGASTLASVLIFVASLFLIRFIMWDNILKEYKSIGIYKALGFTNKEIGKFYIVGYATIAFIGSILGVLASIPILNYTASKVLKYIGNFNGINVDFKELMLIVILFSLIVILNLYFVIRKTYNISPVKALAVGVTSSRKKLTKSLIKNSPSPLALAINDIFKYKKISTFIAASLGLALTLTILFGNLNFTLSRMADNVNVWFGIPKTNITINSAENASRDDMKNVLSYVQKDKRVKNYVYGIMESNDVVLDTKKYKIKSNLYSATVMSSYSDDLGLTTIKGHNPKNENEVAVSINILKEAGLSIGDYIELSVNNKKETYLICGSYDSMMEEGYGLRMLYSSVKKQDPEAAYDTIYTNLENNQNNNTFEKDVNKKFLHMEATSDIEGQMKYIINSIPSIVTPITYMLIAVFIIFSIVTILNIIIMNIRDNRRSFGIMKALGFTYKEIRNRYLYRIILLTLVSILLAVALNIAFSRTVITYVIDNLDVLIISPKVVIELLLSMFVLVVLVTFICCQSIKKAKPTELMGE